MSWRYLDHRDDHPKRNLALEEYLLKERSENFFYLWQNKSSVITGKHQNTWGEVNVPFCEANDITIARRLSGGGTVYHDENNLNFTFILNKSESDNLIDFDMCLSPIIKALNELGVAAEKSQRNDIFIEGKKVSGNAEHLDLRKKRVIHHGTLLFKSDLSKLRAAIRPEREYQSKAVKSVRSPVGNIADYLEEAISVNTFRQLMNVKVREALDIETIYEPDEDANRIIDQLYEEKYGRDEWVFGYSPKFHFNRQVSDYSSEVEVNKGRYVQVNIRAEDSWHMMCKELEGRLFGEKPLLNWLSLQKISQEDKHILFNLLI